MNSVELKDIYKSFGANDVLKNVNFTLKKGSIHALLGENGAGKSTLMNILGGVLEQDRGQILIDGKQITKINPRLALKLGITFVHQELNLINDLAIYKNIFLGEELHKTILLNDKQMIKEARKVLTRLNIDLDPSIEVSNLSNLQKQLIEIAKALHFNSSIIILDEPTSSLTNKEIPELFRILRQLEEQGVSIIYISHKMPEIFAICNEYTVLRDGVVVETGLISETDEHELVKQMSGKIVMQASDFEEREFAKSILKVENFGLRNVFENINFELHKGEVLGLTGLQGDGRLELMESLFGYRCNTSGSITLNGHLIKKTSISKSLKNKVSLVPSNRKENAIIQDLSILENYFLTDTCASVPTGLIKRDYYTSNFIKAKDQLNIKVQSHDYLITSLSGGNQQKVILGRWLEMQPEILLLDNPTQGIDIMAKAEIYELIRELSASGVSIIISSAEVPELKKCCDRVLVFYDKKIVTEFKNGEIDEERIMSYATGSLKEEKQ